MNTGGGHEMTKIVCLETQAILESFIDACIFLFDDCFRVDVAIGSLSFTNHLDGLIHHFIKLLILRNCIHACKSLKRLVKISIVKRRANKTSSIESCSNLKILERVAD